jgi:hypothetical protein
MALVGASLDRAAHRGVLPRFIGDGRSASAEVLEIPVPPTLAAAVHADHAKCELLG